MPGAGLAAVVAKVGARHSQADVETIGQIMALCLGLLDPADQDAILERLENEPGETEEPEPGAGGAIPPEDMHSPELMMAPGKWLDLAARRVKGWPDYLKVAEVVTKPGIDETENEFRYRLRDPGEFEDGSFRTITLKKDKPRVYGIIGRPKGKDTTALQALRFPKGDGWTRAQVREWIDAHPDIGKSWMTWEDDAVETTLEQLALSLRAQLKHIPSGKMLKTVRGVTKEVNAPQFEVEAQISSPGIDRDHEVIQPSAFRKAKDQRIPLVNSHDYSKASNQLGEMTALKIVTDGVLGTFRYLVNRGNPEADWAWTLASEGMAAYSVGFIPRKWEDADLSDEKTMRDVMAGKIPVRTYTDVELLEVSQVIVPSNRDAIQQAVGKGLYTAEDETKLVALIAEKAKDDVLALFNAKAPMIDVPTNGAKAGDEWKVGGARGLSLADDSTWDGAAAEASLASYAGIDGDKPNWATYRRGFVVYNAGDPEKKGSYRLPFAHASGGKLTASKSGLQAVRQRLSGSQTDIPDNVKAAANRFVDSYLGAPEKGLPARQIAELSLSDPVMQVDQVVLLDTDGKLLWRGAPVDLEDILRNAQHRSLSMDIKFDASDLIEGLKQGSVQFDAVLKAAEARIEKAVASLPKIPSHIAEYPTLTTLGESLGASVGKNARRIAQEEVAKALADPEAYPKLSR